MAETLIYHKSRSETLENSLKKCNISFKSINCNDINPLNLKDGDYHIILADSEMDSLCLEKIVSLHELEEVPLLIYFNESAETVLSEPLTYATGYIYYPFTENQIKTAVELAKKKFIFQKHSFQTFKNKQKSFEIVFDKYSKITSASKNFMHFSDLNPENLIGQNLFDVLTLQNINSQEIKSFGGYLAEKQEMDFPGFFQLNDFRFLMYFSIKEETEGNSYKLTIKDLKRNEDSIKELVDIKHTLDQHSIIAITDQKGIIKYANEKFVDISGYSLEELIGKPQKIVNSGYHPKTFFKNLWETVNSGRIWKGEIRNKSKNGNIYWVDTTIVPFMDSQNQPYQFIAIRTDITKRKFLENSQRENEFRYRTIAELTSDFIYCMEAENSEDLRMVWITEAFSSMTGYTSKEIEERGYWKWDKIVHPEDRSSLKAHLGFILDGKIDSSSFRIITKNGMIRWFQDLARPAKDETTGKTLIIGATKDITDMVQAEIAAERLLNFNESLLNSAGEGIIGLDNKGFIAFINPVASSLLAKKEIELLGEDHISAFYHTDKEGKKRTPENSPIMDSLKSGKVVNITEDIFWRNDNIPIHIEYISSPIISDKTVTGSVLIFKDISVRLEAERKIKEAREIAEQANKSKSEFLANMSHELRTPLNSIIGFSKLMKFSKTEEEKLEFSEYIHTSGTHLLRLINELLDYSKIEAGKMQFDRKPVNLSKIAEESITLVFLQAQQKEIKIHFNQGNCNDYCVIGDEKRLKQVVINLLSNAVKFTEKKGSINVDINLGENQISLSVKDTGIGMNQEDIGVIFEKFSQLSSGLARNSEGTGLGLAISKKIIEYHSGKISVDSSPGKGSIFTITLPCFNKANISSSLDSFTNLTSYPESLKTKTILLLDPDQTARSVLEAFFLMNDQKFFSAVSGNEALEIYGSRKIDAIIAEVDLMNSDGIPFAHMIRENNHKIPIIAVTSKQFSISEQEILTKLKKEGYDQFLTKPVDLEIFLNNLKELISLNRL